MKKTKRLTLLTAMICSLLVATFFAINFNFAKADVVETKTVNEIAKYMHENSTLESGLSTGYATYNLGYGDYTDISNLNKFTNSSGESVYKYDGTTNTDCFFYYSGDNVGKISAGTIGKETIAYVTANQNISITLFNDEFNTSAGNLVVRTLLSNGSKTIKVKETSSLAKGATVSANSLGGTYNLKQGDSVYFVVGSTNEYTIRLNKINLAFSIDVSNYSESARDAYYLEKDTMYDIASYVATNEAYVDGYSTDNAVYQLKYGDSTDLNNLLNFSKSDKESVYEYNKDNRLDCFFYYSGNNAGKISAGKLGYESVIVVTPKQNTLITVYNSEFNTTANNLVVKTVLVSGDRTFVASAVNGGAGGTKIRENALGGSYHLALGDKLYFIVASTNEYQIRVNKIEPTFSYDNAGYLATEREKYFPTIEIDNEVDSIEIAKHVSDYSEFDKGYETTTAIYSLRYGDSSDLENLNKFTKSNEISVYEYNKDKVIDCFFYFGTDGNVLTPGMISAGAKGNETVIKVTAKTNFALTIGNKANILPANNLLLTIYATNGTTLVKLEEFTKYGTNTEIQENQFGGTYHLKAGDVIYYVVGSTNEYTIRKLDINPTFVVDESAYLEEKRTEIYAVQETIPTKILELENYVNSLDHSLYTAANVFKMQEYVALFSEDVLLVKNMSELAELYDEYKAKIDDVLTIAETKQELDNHKTSKLAELDAMYQEFLDTNSYSKEGKEELKKAYDSAKENISKATSKNMVNTALAAAKNAMGKVEVSKGGCKGNISTISILSLTVFGAIAVICLKKKENN